ncbi:MAG: sugar phosphate isomerase/epimerase [Lachnospiraceae bacterium]|nr:sugar phosphate isomerase/epimerase [Lachnospiraceae bacterium]
MVRFLCSSGALITSRNGRNYKLLEQAERELTSEGFEFMMYPVWYENWEEIATDVAAMDISVITFHVDKSVGELISRNEEGDREQARENFTINCRMAQMMGAKLLVLHLWGGMPSDRNIDVNIKEYARLRKIAEEYELLLTIEDVPCNQENPLKHMVALYKQYPDVTFTFDIRFAAFHGLVDQFLSKENAWMWQGAIKHIHIGDFAGESMDWGALRNCLHPGEGKIDFARLFNHLANVGYEGTVTVESTSVAEDGVMLTEKLNDTFAYLRRLEAESNKG